MPGEIEKQLAAAFANVPECRTPGCGWSLDDSDVGGYCGQCRGAERVCGCKIANADLPGGSPVIKPADGVCWNCGSTDSRHPDSMPSVMQ